MSSSETWPSPVSRLHIGSFQVCYHRINFSDHGVLHLLVAERGVVCFRAQKRLGHDGHKEIINRLGALSGRPKESTLMQAALWPVYNDDPEVASLVPERLAKRYGFSDSTSKRQNHAIEWHTDMAFEENPPDFSSLRLSPAAETGGGMFATELFSICWRVDKALTQSIRYMLGVRIRTLR